MDLLRARSVRLELAGDAVVEAHPERDDEVGLLDGFVDPGFAVHPHHAEAQGVRRGETAEAEQSRRHGDPGLLDELAKEIARPCSDDPVAGEQHGPLGGIDERDGALQIGVAGMVLRTVTGQPNRAVVPYEVGGRLLGILRDVDEHRPGSTGPRDVERLPEHGRDVLGARDEIVVLGDGERHARDVGLLKRVAPDVLRRDLAGDAHHRNRVEHRRRDAGDEVGRARTGGGDAHAHAARRARVPVGHVSRTLLVPNEDVTDRRLEHRVVGRHDRAARIAEDDVDAFSGENVP